MSASSPTTFSVLFLLFAFISTMVYADDAFGCTVTLKDGKDATEKLSVDSDVLCMGVGGERVCEGAKIEGCARVRCSGEEVCANAIIVDATDKVICEGTKACDSVQIVGTGGLNTLQCNGRQACRRIDAERVKLVGCYNGGGKNIYEACVEHATFNEVGCLYCGEGGCAEHLNHCQYKLAGGNGRRSLRLDYGFEICEPNSFKGDCPAEFEAELEVSLNKGD